MSYETPDILLATGLFLAGLLIGGLITRYGNSQLRRKRELEVENDQLQQVNARYQADVTSHFTKTAALINRMTDAYRDVHEHLANGARTLCDDETFNAMPRLSEPEGDKAALLEKNPPKEQPAEPIEPPRDYVPRESAPSPAQAEKA